MSILNAILLLLLATSCLQEASSYLYMKLATAKKGMCQGQDGKFRPIGSEWYYHKKCEKATCSRQNTEVYEEVMGCGVVAAGGNCRVHPKKKGIYPNCCPTVRCN